MMEMWKDIEGYEKLYQVSSMGKVRSLDRIVLTKNSGYKSLKGRILSPQKFTNGYLFVCLSKNATVKQFIVHRLVALAFVANPRNHPEVNHIDEIKENVFASNLEWTTHKTNINHGTCLIRRSATVKREGTFAGRNNPMFGKIGILNPNSKQFKELILINS
jgi:hypothetical protein